jgi:hypothetical protein
MTKSSIRRVFSLRVVAAALAVLASPALAAPAQSPDTAKAFLTRLYAGYSHGHPDYTGRQAPTIFAPRLLALLKRDADAADGEVGIVEGDPICDCQDAGGLKMQNLTVTPAGTGKARAQAAFSIGRDMRRLTLDLEDRGQGWRIADIHSKDTPSLVGLLEDGLRRQGIALPAGR